MNHSTVTLPVKDTVVPATQDELVAAVRSSVVSDTPLYPIGGGTALDLGLPAKAPGRG